MNYKLWLRNIGLAASFGTLSTWFIIFCMAFIYGNDRVVRITIKADVFYEFWFEFILITIGLVGIIYEIICRMHENKTKKDRSENIQVEEQGFKQQ